MCKGVIGGGLVLASGRWLVRDLVLVLLHMGGGNL